MSNSKSIRQSLLLGAMSVGLAIAGAGSMPETANAQARVGAQQSNDLLLSVGRGRLITLPVPMTDVFVANQAVADVQVRSSTQLYVFGKAPGETSVYATDAAGRVVYSVVTRVGNNIETIDQMLALAMPDAQINVNTMNGFVLLTGTVAAPEDAAEADRLVSAFVGEGTRVLSRLQTATPLQVNLQVRIAEVNRSVVRQIGGNLLSRDNDGNSIIFGAFRGRNSGSIEDIPTESGVIPGYGPNSIQYDPRTGRPFAVINPDGSISPTRIPQLTTIRPLVDAATIGLGGRLFGLDLLGTLDLAERSGLVATLAQPNLTTISGETADFLAGGEYPIPVPDPLTGGITIEYRKFGVSLAYTPTVLSNGRISLRVRPEVSELSTEGAIRLQGIEVPALSIRRAETTVELGSGESFMIAGLMSNRSIGTLDRTPGLGDVPILGTLFKSDNFRRGDTELVIVVTPYLVRPVPTDQIVLPTDAFQNPTEIQRNLLNGMSDGVTGGSRPMPTLEQRPDQNGTPNNAPGIGGMPAASAPTRTGSNSGRDAGAAAPGFSFGSGQ
jgi:pilus assembly protein CpaC